jgi:hypothetical protein
VQIARERYMKLKAHLFSIACHRSVENLRREFWNIPFEPYAPVRKQLLNLLRLIRRQCQATRNRSVPMTFTGRDAR